MKTAACNNFFPVESLFNKNFGKNVSPSGLPSQQAWTNEDLRETESVFKLYYTVNKNYLQHSGLVSSEQRREVHTQDVW
jgi:hypothetical protein